MSFWLGIECRDGKLAFVSVWLGTECRVKGLALLSVRLGDGVPRWEDGIGVVTKR